MVDPETGVTKQALIDYYLTVAPRMVPHVAGRPLSLVRCPNGAGQKCFYQKQLGPGMPRAIEGLRFPRPKATPPTYVTVHSAEGLAGLAQMDVLEVHPWGSTNLDLEHPDRIIFDLDPDDVVSWTTLCEGALEVRERPKKSGCISFVKTTGGKGLHVVAPIRPTLDWERIKAFTHAFTLQMEQDNSKLYISKMTKAARKNEIFSITCGTSGKRRRAPYSSRADSEWLRHCLWSGMNSRGQRRPIPDRRFGELGGADKQGSCKAASCSRVKRTNRGCPVGDRAGSQFQAVAKKGANCRSLGFLRISCRAEWCS